MLRAADGCEYVIHSAAVLGGQTQVAGEHEAVNVVGTGHVLDAAAKVGATRVVQLSTTTFFDAQDAPLTEHSPLDPNPSDDPYTVTKRAAYLDAMRRVEDDGQDICIVISGGAYGMSPLPERSMVAPSYNARIALALAGEITEYVGVPDPVGVRRRRREGVGRRHPQGAWRGSGTSRSDVRATSAACRGSATSRSRSRAPTSGSPRWRVAELDDPDVAARFGPSLVALARKQFPSPFFVNDQTVERLGYEPLPSARASSAPSPGCASTASSDARTRPKGSDSFHI